MFPCIKRSLTRSKEVSLSCIFLSCPTSLPDFLPGRVTPYPISYPNVYRDFYLRLCPIPYPSRYRNPTRVVPECVTRSFTRVLPRHIPGRVNPALPERLPSRVKSYPIAYPAFPQRLTPPGNFLPDHVPHLIRFSYPAR
jgi:hypothetical protein